MRPSDSLRFTLDPSLRPVFLVSGQYRTQVRTSHVGLCFSNWVILHPHLSNLEHKQKSRILTLLSLDYLSILLSSFMKKTQYLWRQMRFLKNFLTWQRFVQTKAVTLCQLVKKFLLIFIWSGLNKTLPDSSESSRKINQSVYILMDIWNVTLIMETLYQLYQNSCLVVIV